MATTQSIADKILRGCFEFAVVMAVALLVDSAITGVVLLILRMSNQQ